MPAFLYFLVHWACAYAICMSVRVSWLCKANGQPKWAKLGYAISALLAYFYFNIGN